MGVIRHSTPLLVAVERVGAAMVVHLPPEGGEGDEPMVLVALDGD